MLGIALFAFAMSVKGGWLKRIPSFPDWCDGNWFSSLIMAAAIDPVFGLFWYIGNSASMRDPAGPDWKLAVLRGVFTGACLTFATGLTGEPNVWYILAGASMPLVYRAAIKLSRGLSWAWAEPAYGAILGLARVL